MDNFYSSPFLFYSLKLASTGAVSTLRWNRNGIAREIQQAKLKQGEEKVRSYGKEISVLKIYDRKPVLLRFTVYDSETVDTGKTHFITKEVIEKLHIMIQYNKYMGGVDANDQLLKYLHFSRRTLKWWKKVLFRLLNICMVDSYISYKEWLGRMINNTIRHIQISAYK